MEYCGSIGGGEVVRFCIIWKAERTDYVDGLDLKSGAQGDAKHEVNGFCQATGRIKSQLIYLGKTLG